MENVREQITSLETFTNGGVPKLDNADATFKKVNMQVKFDGAQGSPLRASPARSRRLSAVPSLAALQADLIP